MLKTQGYLVGNRYAEQYVKTETHKLCTLFIAVSAERIAFAAKGVRPETMLS